MWICPRVRVISFTFEHTYVLAVAVSFKSLLKRPECEVKPEAQRKLELIDPESPDCLISHHVRFNCKLYLLANQSPCNPWRSNNFR